MAITYTPIELWQVKPLLEAKGYHFHGTRSYGVQLTKASKTKRFKDTGAPYREQLAGISKPVLKQILLYSDTPGEAAYQIEALSTGELTAPNLPQMNRSTANIDQESLERMAEARAENIVAEKDAERDIEMQQMRAELKSAVETIKELKVATAPKKRGRPKGSKSKPKAATTASGDPELTDAQQEMLRDVMANQSLPKT